MTRRSGTQFAGNVIPSDRLSPQALAILDLIPLPNAPGRDNGTRDNYVASDSETFNEDSFNVRIDGRLERRREHLRPLQPRQVPPRRADGVRARAAAASWSASAASRTCKNQSLALGVDHTFSSHAAGRLPLRLVPVQRQRAAVRLRHDAGGRRRDSRLNLDKTFTSGLPAAFDRNGDRGFSFGSGLGVNRCNCPLDQDEKQCQLVGNVTKLVGNHTLQVRRRRPPRLQPARAERRAPLGRADLQLEPHVAATAAAASASRRSCSATSPSFGRYVSPSTDARERQWRHFYYAQDTWRADAEADAQLRPAARHHQPADRQRGGQRRLPRSDHRRDPRRRRRRHRPGRQRQEPPELGAAPRRDLPARREDRHPRRLRPQLRHRRVRIAVRPQRDAEPAGAVGAGASTRRTTSTRCSTSRRGRRRRSSRRAGERPVPAAERRVRARAAAEAAAADGGRVQRHRAAPADRHDVGRGGYVGNRGRNVRRRRPGRQRQPADARRLRAGRVDATSGGRSSPATSPTRPGFGGAFGWTQGIDYFCNCAHNCYNSLQTKFTKRFCKGYSLFAQYTLQHADNNDGELLLHRSRREPWYRGLGSHAQVHRARPSTELPFGQGKTCVSDISHVRRRVRRRLAVQHEHDHPERPPVQRHVSQRRRRTATPGRTGPT